MIETIHDIGSSVMHGGASTLLGMSTLLCQSVTRIGVLVLAFASSTTFRTFFFILFGTVFFGLLYGLLLFPVLLSLFPSSIVVSNPYEFDFRDETPDIELKAMESEKPKKKQKKKENQKKQEEKQKGANKKGIEKKEVPQEKEKSSESSSSSSSSSETPPSPQPFRPKEDDFRKSQQMIAAELKAKMAQMK